MSDENNGMIGELKKWLEFEDTPESEALGHDDALEQELADHKEELAMESDSTKRKLLKEQIKAIEIRLRESSSDETATTPTGIIGEY